MPRLLPSEEWACNTPFEHRNHGDTYRSECDCGAYYSHRMVIGVYQQDYRPGMLGPGTFACPGGGPKYLYCEDCMGNWPAVKPGECG